MDRRQLFGAVFGAACAFLFVGRAPAQGAGRDAELIRAAEAGDAAAVSACSRSGRTSMPAMPRGGPRRCRDLRITSRPRGADRGGADVNAQDEPNSASCSPARAGMSKSCGSRSPPGPI